MIQGERTDIRAIELDDVEIVYGWMNHPAVQEGWGRSVAVMSRNAVSRQIASWIDAEASHERPVGFVISTLEDRSIGLLVALPVDAEGRTSQLSLLIGDPADWGQGYAADALDAFLDAIFDGWNAHRVWIEVEAGNERALRLYRSAGFQHEATLRHARFMHGDFHAVERMAVTAAAWRARQAAAPVSNAQDPEEPFDVINADGTATGRSKARWQIHRDGDWHRAIHLWIYGEEQGAPFLDVQRRGLEKDTWPGRLDATVAGHLRAGEGIAEALREADEEVGLTITIDDVLHAGTHISVTEIPGNRRDLEHQEILLFRYDQPLDSYRPNTDEVDGIVRLPLQEAIELLDGRRPSVAGRLLAAATHEITDIEVRAEDFIPSVDRYTLRVSVGVGRAVAGTTPIVV